MADKRLIETAFPLRQASAASLHEKNMRHGHISTLHLWPARRPLAASRAAIAAALLPDPGEDEARKTLVRRLGGGLKVKQQTKAEAGKKVDTTKVEGDGGVLWWGQENLPDMAWFRDQIRAAQGGRAPRVLDPFAGGGAIPLEAMRLGCEVVANDLNPVAWFILKCTLEYPQRLSGKTRPLPTHAMRDPTFATAFLKAQGLKGGRLELAVARMTAIGRGETAQDDLLGGADRPWEQAGLGWQVRAWGNWVLVEAQRELAVRYPTYAEWQNSDPKTTIEPRPLHLLPHDGRPTANAIADLNPGLSGTDLRNPIIPRWVVKPTVAYLWARTVPCKACRATIPLLKTRWLCKKEEKRVVLEMAVNGDRNGMAFAVRSNVPNSTGTSAQRKAADKALGGGTMSGSSVACPCCKTLNKKDDIRYAATHGSMNAVMTAVVVDGPSGKEYRQPTAIEIAAADCPEQDVRAAFADVPFGMPAELIPIGGSRSGGGSPFTPPQYGLTQWTDIFTPRQLITLATFVKIVRKVPSELVAAGYEKDWCEGIWALLGMAVDRIADRSSSITHWDVGYEKIANTFSGYRLPISWDFSESCPTGGSTGSFSGQIEWVAKTAEHTANAGIGQIRPLIGRASALTITGDYDAIVTDPPYYDAIPYSDLMDFFYIWLRRCVHGLSAEVDEAFASPIGPKWDHETGDGELVDDASRFGGDKSASKKNFENGMAAVFRRCHSALSPSGIFVIVFANKNPDAWETLVGALIRAGFVVDGSLPIQTEMGNRTRAQSSAALSSSVWLVCRKRTSTARPGFAAPVLAEMREKIRTQMHRFWDAGIRGPDFVWAATGPALEAYSRHPVVRRETSTTGLPESLPVAEFLREVRRLVVEFAVGRVLKPAEAEGDDPGGLDDITTYYVLHRDSFGLAEAPIGACILYAMSCGLSDADLADRFEVLARSGGKSGTEGEEQDDEESDAEGGEELESEGSGSKVRLRRWDQRKRKTLGLEGVGGRPVPLIDRAHRLMQLWKAGDVAKVNVFLDQAGLPRDALFAQLVQALIELANRDGKGDEAPILESISNHLRSRAGVSSPAQALLL
jgi:adenine-specific DNA methylase